MASITPALRRNFFPTGRRPAVAGRGRLGRNFTPQVPFQQVGVPAGRVSPGIIPPGFGGTQPVVSGPATAQPAPVVGQPIPVGNFTPQQPGPAIGQPGLAQPAFNPQGAQFGLSGAESAFQGGTQGAVNQLQGATAGALNTLLAGFNQGGTDLNSSIAALSSVPSARASAIDPNTGQPLFARGVANVQQFQGAGLDAQRQQAALSGALGPAAQSQAIAAFNSSPAQAFLRQQGQNAVINNAAALGGLGGGNVQKELARFNQGLAAQDFGANFARLGTIANQGLSAAEQASGLLGRAGAQQGALAGQNAQLATSAALANARQAGDFAQARANVFGQKAQNAANLASLGARLQQSSGSNIAQLLSGVGNRVGAARLQAGRDLANQIQSAAGGVSGLNNAQGASIADLIRSGTINLSNLLTGAGGAASAGQNSLAALLANLSTGAATNVANINLAGGKTGATLAQRQGANQTQFLQNLLSAGQFGGLFDKTPPVVTPPGGG